MLREIPGADAFCIALIIMPVCIVPLVISEHFRPYQPVQVVHDTPKIVKLQDRLTKERT